ncbi:posterior protein-like [Aquarana catesbeiana]|uniref:posterior protein-like n=1 Tax=Aquarana catesbeiana TaxID=8400 RepID=UPI003CCA5D2E
MEAIEGFVNKYGCVRFESIKENALTHQYNDLLRQCNTHNDAIKHKKSSKKGKKQRLANAVCVLLKMKEIAEQKELIAKIEVSKGVSEVAANTDSNVCECDELRDEIEQLVIENGSLEQKLDELEETCMLREQCIASLGQREAGNEAVIEMFKRELQECKNQLAQKDHTILSLKAQAMEKVHSHCCANRDTHPFVTQELGDRRLIEQQPIYSADNPEESPNQSSSLFTPGTERTGQGLGIIRREGNTQSTALSIQDRTNLCQILGKFDTSASPISLSNRREAVVAQYILNNRDACALLRAWLPLQLCEKLQPPVGSHRGLTPELNSNWGNSADRMREMQRIMGGRDTRGSDALENTKFRRGMDPILFCSEYLSIYKATYNCPDMSPDDGSFLCSMANKCTCIDYHTRIALRNATSYQTFLNTLRDWVRETEQDNRPHKRISEIAKSEGRVRFTGKCYRCGNTGHLIKDCKLPRRSTGEKKPWHKKERQKPGPDKVAKEPSEAPDATVYGPLLRELQRVGK